MGLPAPEVFAGASPAGLYFVGDPEDAVLVEDVAEGRVEAVGWCGEASDALDGFGDEGGGGAGVAEEVFEVVDAGGDEGVVVEVGVGASGADAAVDVLGLEGERLVGDQPLLPVMPTELNERPW